MANGWSPPGRGRHVFVVLRGDDTTPSPTFDHVVATKAFDTLVEAEAEADRLNVLNVGKRGLYFVRVARLQERVTFADTD